MQQTAQPSAAVLARLREHCNGGPGGCKDCRPAMGIYCAQALPDAVLFAELRRAEVRVAKFARVELAARGRAGG
jgi:hypothetical protein